MQHRNALMPYLALVHDVVPVVGWLAAVLVLGAYGLMMAGRVGSSSVLYLGLNAVGSLGLGVSTVAAHAWQSAFVNVLWLVFGIAPFTRAVRRAGRAADESTCKPDPVPGANAGRRPSI